MQFQSTLPRRERRRKPKQGTNHVNISIHAPAKGATHRIRDLQRKDRFQSTLPRRERHRLHLIKRSDMNFNPRSREGSDGKYLYGIRRQHHFNPRSREGSDDLRQMGQGRPCRDFNPRSREGSDCPLDGPTLVGQISIHAPAKGATSTVPDDYPQYCVFQSTLPRRERLLILLHIPKINKFQSTLPRRERL